MSTVLDKFLRYVKIDTQSQDGATTVPSTDKQRNLASLLAQELNDMGAQDVVYDKAHCYVYARRFPPIFRKEKQRLSSALFPIWIRLRRFPAKMSIRESLPMKAGILS